VVDAIVRSFKTLDNEILEDARKSDIKDCQYGGTTALLALLFDRVIRHWKLNCANPCLPYDPSLAGLLPIRFPH
jgi:hypothetical protein